MGEIRFVGTGETRGYPYLVCKKKIVGPGKARGYHNSSIQKKLRTSQSRSSSQTTDVE